MKNGRREEAERSAERRAAMAALATASGGEIRRLWDAAGFETDAQALRGPETGLVTVRGRIGGAGAPSGTVKKTSPAMRGEISMTPRVLPPTLQFG
jgi:alpha-D-ribose 1-methylphosphonate 5-triphosphate synthase subunit PhnG